MFAAKPVIILGSLGKQFSQANGELLSDPSIYKNTVRTL